MITVIADDLSGAAEAAEQFRLHGHAVVVRLANGDDDRTNHSPVDVPGETVRVIDTDSRAVPPQQAFDAVHRAIHALTGDRLLVKKIDSLWRGNLPTEIDALRRAGYRLVVAGALPALGRTVVHGRPTADCAPLADSPHWHLEARPAPATVSEALGIRDAGHLPLPTLRSSQLSAALAKALVESDVIVADGETDADLALVAAATIGLVLPIAAGTSTGTAEGSPAAGGRIALVGSAALAAAVAAHVAPAPRPASAAITPSDLTDSGPRPALIVVGSGSHRVAAQLDALRASGTPVVTFDPGRADTTDDDVLADLSAALESTCAPDRDGRLGVALALVSDERVDAHVSVHRLARIVAETVAGHPPLDLVLTGGETARCVLDLLGVDTLRPLGQVEHGAVVSTTPDGRLVATKPGSFGSPAVLVALRDALTALREPRASHPSLPHPSGDPVDTLDTPAQPAAQTSVDTASVDTASVDTASVDTASSDTSADTAFDTRPFIAVTMGDGAGVGPEVTVGALLDEAAYRDARPIVIGDAYRLRLGAAALGVEADVVEIDEVEEAVFTPGRINVIDPHLLSPDLPWGKVSAEAGNAAFHYIRIACELGMAGKVQGICTAPLNKAALHEAGHVFPGHTELLAHFMGVGEVSMMLSTPKIKVIHVTTHIGLIDAIAKIEPGLVERTVRRGWEALRRAGVEDPIIGVCAINPHAGENGLFGYGEEAEKITPAIEILQAEGMRVAGPLPADTAFFLGGRGDYDLIVAMYHDQGHGPVKVLGIEAGVNITVGLPVIRTSVDHGTAFDIAGKGVVAVGSMIEALRQAVEMSPSPVAA
ncbi:4-hydroxythreonine-4-phosphate dehydrogenase PdxA [Frondihabitans cladoniiphilus]|uniref:4-hydroxythreonine-4-phosphate dehydrogenase n=1 Tax=Frondihabitans cladoniiphilus TaxID=715785 RepID=A0ABP8W900_9MICO